MTQSRLAAGSANVLCPCSPWFSRWGLEVIQPYTLILPMGKQDPETCDFPKSCGKLKMKIMTMSPYRAFLTKACPLLL